MSSLPDADLVATLAARIAELEGRGTFKPDAEERGKRREVYANAVAIALEVLDRVGEESFAHSSSELLREWRNALGAPNDAARTTAEEQKRLAAMRAVGWSRERLTAALALVGLTGDAALETIESDLGSLSAEFPVMLHVAMRLSEADWSDGERRRSTAALLRRALPTRHLGQMDAPNVSRQVVTAIGPQWQTANAADGNAAHLGRVALGRFGGGYTDSGRAPNRLRSYGSLSTLEAADLDAIQRASLMFAPDGDTGFGSGAGIQSFHRFGFTSVSGGGLTTVLDDGGDFDDRLVWVTGRVSTTNIMPGSGNDAADAGSPFGFCWYTGTGGFNYRSPDLPGGGGRFEVDSSDRIVFQATGGASTQYLYVQMMISGKTGQRETASQLPAVANEPLLQVLEDGDSLSGLTASFPATLRAFSAWIPLGGMPAYAGFSASYSDGHDAVSRFGIVLGEAGETYTLDSEVDWRDRLITTTCIEWDPYARPLWPGLVGSSDDEYDIDACECWYSGDGGSGASGTWDHVLTGFADTHQLWADPTSGALKITLDSTTPGKRYAVAVMAKATGQIGQYHGGGAKQLTADVTSGGDVQPSDLNLIQDVALWEQFMSDPGSYGVEPTNGRSDCMPLGPIGIGEPPLPLAWEIPVAGFARAGVRPTWERRQRMAFNHRIIWQLYCPNASGNLVIDDHIDWRERFVYVSLVARSGTDITAGAANDDNAGWASAGLNFQGMLYTGNGEGEYEFEILTDLFIFADPTTGRLFARNDAASFQSFVLMAEATSQLGTRRIQ